MDTKKEFIERVIDEVATPLFQGNAEELREGLEALAEEYKITPHSEENPFPYLPKNIKDIYFDGSVVRFGDRVCRRTCSLKTSRGRVLVYLLNNMGKKFTAEEIYEGSGAKSMWATKNSLRMLDPEINKWTKYFEFKKIKSRPARYTLKLK